MCDNCFCALLCLAEFCPCCPNRYSEQVFREALERGWVAEEVSEGAQPVRGRVGETANPSGNEEENISTHRQQLDQAAQFQYT